MKLFLVILGLLNIELIYCGANDEGRPVPMPQSYTTTNTQFSLDARQFKFKFNKGSQMCDVTKLAFTRYHQIIFTPEIYEIIQNRRVVTKLGRPNQYSYKSQVKALNELLVHVEDPCELYPTLESDESYTLQINNGNALIHSKTAWGSLRGLETFNQLVIENGRGEFLVNETYIKDYPRFNHRGLLLDTSRHYLSVELLKINLEAMEANKMNVFHWHIVDDNSFPYQSSTFPELSDQGAFDPFTHIYTSADVAEVIEFARQRGIRVIPEFDTPGHTQSWGNAVPILTPCYTNSQMDGTFGPIDPTRNETYSFLRDLLKEVATVFPDKYMHLGGDEVSFDCWKSNPKINEFMRSLGIENNYNKLEGYYIQKLLDIVEEINPSNGYMIWQEVFDNKVRVKQDTIVHVWKAGWEQEMNQVTAAGYRSLLSSCWYLDLISYGPDWKNYYNCDPHNFEGTQEQKNLVIGGESCVWGEFIDGANVIPRSWPRSSAIAERLWSSQNVTDLADATARLEAQRCKMIRRGINAQPLNGPGYCEYEVSV